MSQAPSHSLTVAKATAAVRKHDGNLKATADALGVSYWSLRRVLRGMNVTAPAKADPAESLAAEFKLRQDNERLKGQLKAVLGRQQERQSWEEFVSSVSTVNRPRPEWLVGERSRGKGRAIACACLSDIHYGEVVRPEEVEGMNSFDSEIARARIQTFFRNVVALASDYVAGVEVEGIVLNLLGDNISGEIHEELAESNDRTLAEAVLEVSEHIALGIRLLAEEFGKVEIVGVPGNHGRLSRKPRAKQRSRKNLDWLVYSLLQRDVRDKRVSWLIGDGADVRFRVYDTTFLATHGDQFRGGSGIAAALSPLLLGDHRKRKRASAMGHPYDLMLFGHWHQLFLGLSGMVGNGSVIGYNEFAYLCNLAFEEPQQAFFLVDPNHGLTMRAPVRVIAPTETWQQEVA